MKELHSLSKVRLLQAIAANWNAPDIEPWTVPIGSGYGRAFAVGSQPLNASVPLY